MPSPDDIDEAFFQLNNLALLSRAFYVQMAFSLYKDIASRLRFLFTGSSRQPGFIIRVLPNVQLPPLRMPCDPAIAPGLTFLHGDIGIEDPPMTLMAAGCKFGFAAKLHVKPGPTVERIRIRRLFSADVAPIPLQDWLSQPFLRPERSLSVFIREVANKDGGAHKESNPMMEHLRRVGNVHWHLIGAIAGEVGPQIMAQFNAAYPNHSVTLE